MRNLVVAAVLMCSVAAWSEQPNSADYPLTVHVVRSRLIVAAHANNTVERLNVLISGKKFELEGPAFYGVISPGEYKGRVMKDRQNNNFSVDRSYELLFPDNTTETFMVTGESE